MSPIEIADTDRLRSEVETLRQILETHEKTSFEQARKLEKALEDLERSNRELDQFAYAASHDLRAPLRGISNLVTWLEEDHSESLDEEAKEYLRLMRSRVGRLEMLIEGLLEFSRIGRVRGSMAETNVEEMVREVTDMLGPAEGIAVEVETPLPSLRTERLRLRQVFHNLLTNAVKYARSRVKVGAEREGAYFRFHVSDDGEGIPEEYQTKIWGIFQRLETREEVEGTGIGLAMVKKIVEDQGGRAWVVSKPGEGATFYFQWPAASGGSES